MNPYLSNQKTNVCNHVRLEYNTCQPKHLRVCAPLVFRLPDRFLSPTRHSNSKLGPRNRWVLLSFHELPNIDVLQLHVVHAPVTPLVFRRLAGHAFLVATRNLASFRSMRCVSKQNKIPQQIDSIDFRDHVIILVPTTKDRQSCQRTCRIWSFKEFNIL